MIPLPESDCEATSTVPSGFLIHILPAGTVIPVKVNDNLSPFVAETYSEPFWPGVARLNVCVEPSADVFADWSPWNVQAVRVWVPFANDCGSTLIVYVPVCVRSRGSIHLIPTTPSAGMRVVPSGFLTMTFRIGVETLVSLRLRFQPAVPLNVNEAFCPGVVVISVPGLPDVRAAVGSAGTL